MSSSFLRMCALLAAAGACASGSGATAGGTTAESPQSTATATRERDVISREELSEPALRAQSVLAVVRSLRPHFLSERGKNSHSDEEAGKVHVSVNGGRILPLDELNNMSTNEVLEIRYLNPALAMQKFGGAAREGPVILVKTM